MSPLRRMILAALDPPDETCRVCRSIILMLIALLLLGAILARLV